VKNGSHFFQSLQTIVLILFFSSAANAWNTPIIGGGNSYTKYTWTGANFAVNSNFSNPLNWCGSYIDGACQGAATAPGGTDTVVFNAICGAHCNATIDTNITINGVMLASDYTGTISQGAFNVTVTGSTGNGWSQAAGTWLGGAGTLTIGAGVTQVFKFTGGTFTGGSGAVAIGHSQSADIAYFTGGNFTASSTTTSINGVADFRGLTSFAHNNGTFIFNGGTNSTVGGDWFTGTSAVFNNVQIVGPTSSNISMNSTTMTVDGTLTLSGASLSTVQYGPGTIDVRQGSVYRTQAQFTGSVVIKLTGTGMQTIDMTGTINTNFPAIWAAQTAVTGSVKFVGTTITVNGGFWTTGNMGTIDHGNLAFTFYDTNPAAGLFDTQGYVQFPNLTIGGNALRVSFGTVKAVNLVINSGGSANSTNTTGVVEVTGNVTFAAAGSIWPSVVKLLMNGTGNQVVDCTGATTCGMPSLEVNKTSGDVSFVGTPAIFHDFNYITAGSFTVPTNIQFGYGSNTAIPNVTSNGINWNNVIRGGIASSSHGLTFVDLLQVSGNLTLSNTNSSNDTLGGQVDLTGNLSCTASATGMRWQAASNGLLRFVGVNQTIDMSACNATPSSSGLVVLPRVEIANTGTVSSTSSFQIPKYTFTSGAADFRGSTITLSVNSGLANTAGTTAFGNLIVNASGGTLNGTYVVNGDLTLNSTVNGQSISGGTFDVYGNVIESNQGYVGSMAMILHGTNSTITRTSVGIPTGTITVAKNAGQKVTLLSNLALNANQSVSVTGGSIDIGSNLRTLTISGSGTLTLAAGTSVALSSGTLMVGGSSIPAGAYSGGTITP
jgi:hypothetical protein